jgi:hypothetical protein
MRILIAKIGLLAVACVLTVAWLAFGSGPYADSLAIVVYKRELLRESRSPKLVLMGGSGILNGIDSHRLAEEFGVRVVNVGAFVGCGSEYAADYIVPYLRAGDVVLLIPEYSQFKFGLALSDNSCRPWLARALFPWIPSSLYQHPRDVLLDITDLAASKTRGFVNSIMPGDARRTAMDWAAFRGEFDEFGDSLADFRAAPVLGGRVDLAYDQAKIDRANEVLQDFARRAAYRQATLRVVPQAIPMSWFVEERQEIDRLVASLDPKLMLGNAEDYVYQDSMFQDTVNHLGSAGRSLRTERLSRAMRDKAVFRPPDRAHSIDAISPARYDLITGFETDRIWTRGDARFHCLEHATKEGPQFLIVNTNGWVPYRNDLKRLGLRVFADGGELKFARRDDLSYWFEIPSHTPMVQEIRIVSNVFRPVDLGINADGRTLGVDVASIAFR